MFERYTESARRALFFARDGVSRLGGATVEPEHLLLGLMRASEPLLASTFGLTAQTQADLLAEIARRSAGQPKLPSEAEMPFSSATTRVLQFAADEADALIHRHIGPEHLLLGLLREESEGGHRDLSSRGISLKAARDQAAALKPTADEPWSECVSEDEPSVRATVDRLHQAIRDRDVDATAAAFAPGAVMFTLAPPLRFTSASSPGLGGIRDWFASFDGPIGYEVRDLALVAGPEVACAHALIRITGKRGDGSVTDIWVRETLGIRRFGRDWKVIHQHQSVPLYMDGSNRAATDLKP